MEKNKKIASDIVNHRRKPINTRPDVEKPKIFLLAALQSRIAELEKELTVTKFHLSERQQVLDAIPECSLHGKNCVPHALDWIGKHITQTTNSKNNETPKIESKLLTEKWPPENAVQFFAETYNVPLNIVRKIMRDKATNGTYEKNKSIIYSVLCKLGYIVQVN